ncbi:eCIS core domain-containing protein [Nostoc sp.]|uniref:eCIS core domain-containing protein n=1 Tax=Nostoc sp. TaxID=1180 RepID=UPI002FFC820D
MREHVSKSKKATSASFSIPSLKHRIPGFGSDYSQASPQAVPLVQPLHKPLTHDISRIPLRNPQAKLSISQPGDKYEQEADSVAQQVMQRIAQPVNRQSIQPEALPEESELQMKPLANSIRPLQRQEMPESEEELQMKSLDNSTLQRQEVPEDDEELQMKPMVQRRAGVGMAAAPDIEASINQARGGGQVMAENIRHPMERAFGADFSGVKVHTDGQSDQLNRSIQARAFTTGQDVFFRQGEYNPGSRGGQELLAHELTHVVQQSESGLSSHEISRLTTEKSSSQKENNIIQTYRCEGAEAPNQNETRSIENARNFLAASRLDNGTYFHVTNVKNMVSPGGIIEAPNLEPARGGEGGAGAALGGGAGAGFQLDSKGYSFATNMAKVALEYFELHLSTAVLKNDQNLAPVLLKVERRTKWDEQPDPAQEGAIMTPNGFKVLELLYSSDYFSSFQLRG